MLDERKKSILKAIIEDYIYTAEPVGSRTIARKYELGLSSATIRLEMADLEELGFLVQPHTSAGRVPSDMGYRFYVNELVDANPLSADKVQNIKKALEAKIHEVQHLIRVAASLLSSETQYTSMATSPFQPTLVVKTIQLIWVDEKKVLVVLVANGNIVKNNLVRLSNAVSRDLVQSLSNYLARGLEETSLQQVKSFINRMDPGLVGWAKKPFEEVVMGIVECVSQIDICEYILDGTRNILNYPEFKDLEKAKMFLEMMDQKELVGSMLQIGEKEFDMALKREVDIQIGQENSIQPAKQCSIVITHYSLGNSVIGSFGIIGPTRMEYEKVIAYLSYIRRKVNQEIQKLIMDE